MRLAQATLWALAYLPLALGDVRLVYPSAGETLSAGVKFSISWEESSTKPLIKDLTKYSINLYSGSNTSPVLLTSLTSGTFTSTQTTAEILIPASAGGLVTNAYFIGIESEGKAGGTIINYSSRFTASGMTGTFKPEVAAALKDVADTSGPPTKNNVKGSSSSSDSAATESSTTAKSSMTVDPNTGPYATPYNLQTGLVRYAPMQSEPPKKITKTDVKPQWPTSSQSIATKLLEMPSITKTETASRTHSVASHPCSATPQPLPSDDWERYLDRWKDL